MSALSERQTHYFSTVEQNKNFVKKKLGKRFSQERGDADKSWLSKPQASTLSVLYERQRRTPSPDSDSAVAIAAMRS
jgi:hypothetical protein